MSHQVQSKQTKQSEQLCNESVKLHNETFLADSDEKFLLDGEYKIETNYINHLMRVDDKNKPNLEKPNCFDCKAVFIIGNILYKSDEPNVFYLIDLMIEATHSNKLVQSMDRSKCGNDVGPMKETAFIKNGKVFILYGRYIYGFDKNHIHFTNEKPKISDDEEEEEEEEDVDSDWNYDNDEEYYYKQEKEKEPKLSETEIILPTVSYENPLKKYTYDHNYCFTIIDEKSNVVIAFAVYR